ncbi:MAG: glycoside hydrolase family 5 protein [Alphaproteobacteria bacterium]
MSHPSATPNGTLAACLAVLCLLLAPGSGVSASPTTAQASAGGERPVVRKIDLWSNETGPHLRGSAIAQRRRDPRVPGDMEPYFLGPDPMGKPYRQHDFDRLAAFGANVVTLSHPGPFAEEPPFALDEVAQANLDRLIDLAERADLFVVISFRAGPGRSEYTFHPFSGDTWFPKELFNDSVWKDPAAQEAWVEMWRHVAQRYRDRTSVIAYDPMSEPNSHLVGSGIDDRLEIYDPAEFHRRYGGTSYDWNELYPRIVAAVREVDTDTPVLISGNGYANMRFLPYVQVIDDPAAVYAVHQYEPWQFTHQEPHERIVYPGMVDPGHGAPPFRIDKAYLEGVYATIDRFRERHGVRVAVSEFGLKRFAPGGPAYLADQIDIIEARRMNGFIWHWPTSHEPYERVVNHHNYLFGTDPESKADVPDSPYEPILRGYWGKNHYRPSNVTFERSR